MNKLIFIRIEKRKNGGKKGHEKSFIDGILRMGSEKTISFLLKPLYLRL